MGGCFKEQPEPQKGAPPILAPPVNLDSNVACPACAVRGTRCSWVCQRRSPDASREDRADRYDTWRRQCADLQGLTERTTYDSPSTSTRPFCSQLPLR